MSDRHCIRGVGCKQWAGEFESAADELRPSLGATVCVREETLGSAAAAVSVVVGRIDVDHVYVPAELFDQAVERDKVLADGEEVRGV